MDTLIYDGPEFIFDPRVNRYRFKDSGKFVNASQFRSLTRKFLKHTSAEIESLTADRLDGVLPHYEWREKTLKSLKTLAIQSYVLERGGASRVKDNDQKLISEHLAKQFGYFRNLSAQINQGLLSREEAIRRIKLYVRNAGTTDSIAQIQNEAGTSTFGFRLIGSIRPCPDCLRYQGLGVVPISQLVAPGTNCVCGDHCDCTSYLFDSEIMAKQAKITGKLKGARKVNRRKFAKTVS